MKKFKDSSLGYKKGLRGVIKSLVMPLALVSNPLIAQGLTDAQCADRVSIAITGDGADAAHISSSDPQSAGTIDALLAEEEFNLRFASFVNAEMNDGPGETSLEDASYHMVLYALRNNLPWSEVFTGKYNVVARGDDGARVTPDEQGLGYIRSNAWVARYAGNEGEGVRINTAYRVMQNTFGLDLIAADLNGNIQDDSATGRQQVQPCKDCHFDQFFALDPVAEAFPRVVYNGNGVPSFPNAPSGEKTALGGQSFVNEADLMNILVSSEDHKYFVCKTAYKYLTGRPENTCGKPVMDKCLTAFKSSGKIRDALKSIATEATFCQ